MIKKLLGLILFSILTSICYSQVYHNEWIDYNKTYYKFKVFGFGTDAVNAPIPKGMVRIPYSTIAANGLAGTNAEHFQLWRDGEEVPVYVSKPSGPLGGTDYIEFWGEINNGKLDKELYRDAEYQLNDKWSLQTDTAAYFLTINTAGNNKRLVNTANNVSGNTLSPTPYFMNTVGRYYRAELLNGFSAQVGQNLYSSSYDRGEGYVSRRVRPNNNNCGGSPQLPQTFSNLAAYTATGAPDMRLNINSVGDAPNSRSFKVILNGDSITTEQMDYFYDSKVEAYVPVNKIASNVANLFVINQSTQECDEMRVAIMELTYPRTFDMTGFSNFEMTVDNSTNPQQGKFIVFTNLVTGGVLPVIYDVANGKRYVGDTSETGKVKLLLEPSFVPYKLVLSTQAGTYYKAITDLQKRNFVNYKDAVNQGNYLIISNPIIYGSGSNNYVEQYRQYRTSAKGGSYIAQVVDVNELVDQFTWGIKKHPLSIKNFLKFARNTFTIKPKYAFLIGKGVTYNEYHANESNPLIEQLNLVPTFGYPASDNLLSSDDIYAIPTTPIGRLSAVSPQEVGDYLQKVKQYDSAQQSTSNTIKDKDWMKNVLQIAGANDLSLGTQLDGYLEGYKNIIKDTAFGARVTDYSKTGDPAHYTDAVVSFKNTYETGSSLITYFGHSSATSLDFNLDNPEAYDNRQKYPVFIANGCSAGNHFGFEENRFNNKTTISEKFVLANQRGAIGYLASSHFGVINYLDAFTQQFYKAFAKTKYNQPIGDAIKEGITRTLEDKGYEDYYARVHAEEYAYHGDPAIKLNASSLPDYAIEESQIETSPSFVSIADTSFNVKVRIHNLGRAITDSVNFKLLRELPNGKTITVLTKKLGPINLSDSITVTVPIIGNRDKGFNTFRASIDFDDQILEITNDNNTASKTMEVSENEIRTIYPYKNALVSSANFKFQASTVNPLSASRDYVIEVDTTDYFNSSLKASQVVTSKGGVIEFSPSINLQNNTVYYWRVAPVIDNPHWNSASFKYDTNSEVGFEQSHYYQHLKAGLDKIYIDSTDRKFKYTQKTNNLFIVNSIYPTSGTEDGHFSVSVNGAQIIASACDGPVLQYNVFDPITFKPWLNPAAETGLYGSVSTSCAITRQYNFDFLTFDTASRRNAVKFMDLIPKGSFVVVRIVASADESVNVYAAKLRSDTALFGSNNSIYHRLKDAGFAIIDSFNRARTFSFVYKKGDTSFVPQYVMSDGIYDRINLNVNCYTPDTLGYISSLKYGPAKAWKRVKWSGSSLEENNDVAVLQVIGTKADGTSTVLYNLNTTQPVFDISSVSAAQYPFIQLRMSNQDAITATPYQLNYYQVEYEASPEGGVAPNLYFNMPDTVGAPRSLNSDTFHIGVAYKNASKVNFDSLSLKLVLYDTLNNAIEIPLPKTRPLAAGDTLHIDVNVDARKLQGLYNVYLEVNPKSVQYEQESFNNFLYKYVYVMHAATLPITLSDFTATLEGNNVKTAWTVKSETSTKYYIVQHSSNGTAFSLLGRVDALNNSNGTSNYQYTHTNAPVGKNYYRLIITDNDGTTKLSPVRLVTIGKDESITLYPNPVKDKLTIAFKTQINKPGTVTLINEFGQHLLQKKINSTITIDMAAFASGTYMVQVDDGINVTTYKVQKQ